jgi:hypothetical protein
MAGKYITASISPPKRVQIVKVDTGSGYWKPGQFGYAISYSTYPGMFTMDKGPSKADELSYLVSKSKGMRGGALWFSADGLRFTGKEKAPKPTHARKKKIDHTEAKRRLKAAGIDFSSDSDELRMSDLELVADTARETGYKKHKGAPASTGAMYFRYLKRLP